MTASLYCARYDTVDTAAGTDVDAGSLLCRNLSKIAVFIVSLFREEGHFDATTELGTHWGT